MNLLELKAAQDKTAKEVIDAIPYDAWRFFGPLKEIKIDGNWIALSENGDMFQIGDVEFKTCLEFWVNQCGGTIQWK